jgi:hypothetical protein
LGGFGQDDLDMRTILDEDARQRRGFVGRNAAGNAEDDRFA